MRRRLVSIIVCSSLVLAWLVMLVASILTHNKTAGRFAPFALVFLFIYLLFATWRSLRRGNS